MTRRMIFPDRVLGMSATIQMFFGRAILPISVSIALATFCSISRPRANPGLSDNVHLDRAAPSSSITGTAAASATSSTVMQRRLELLGPEPVTGDVDHVVDAAEDPEVAVGGLDRAVAREVRPVAPVLAVLVAVVLRVVDLHEALGLTPDRLKDARPGIADADVAGRPLPASTSSPILVVDHGVDPEHPGPQLPGFIGWSAGRVLPRNPPFSVCHQVSTMIASPLPTTSWYQRQTSRLDRLAHGRHVLEVVVVLVRLIGTELAQHADRRGRGVEDVHPEALGDPPGTTGIRDRSAPPSYITLVVPSASGPVDDVGMPGDPADVGEAPVRVLRDGCPGSTSTCRRRRTCSRRCCAGRPSACPVVPLVYIRNSGASAGMDTGSTTAPR